jgi:anti-sigma factor (TIGR02949 family)
VITCQNCKQALHPYMDRELSDEDIVQVRQHLDACPGCLHLFEFEAAVRRLVRVRCREQLAPDALRARIAACLAIEATRQAKRRPNAPRAD